MSSENLSFLRTRQVQRVIASQPTSDGAGVKLRRSLGSAPDARLDPFLMLDEFGTDNPGDYIAGFPSHPHRGFQTVTYMLDGRMQHKDHLGNVGDLGPGSVQWMSAGRGVIHSEMPLQESGRMRGFQLWLNLPGREKMKPAWYRDIAPTQIPRVALPRDGEAKVIAGRLRAGDKEIAGPINDHGQLATDPLYFDLALAAGGGFEHALPAAHNAFVYVYEGEVRIGDRTVPAHAAGILSAGERVAIEAGAQGARMILLAARPLNEPVVQYGPFVMNTREEIEQTLRDYASGELVSKAS